MAYALAVRLDTLRSIAFGSVSTTYALLGPAFTHVTRTTKISNNTDGDMLFAFTNGSVPASDGTGDNAFVAAGGFTLYDYSSNGGESQAKPFAFQVGTQVWVRYASAPSKGTVYLETVFGKGE